MTFALSRRFTLGVAALAVLAVSVVASEGAAHASVPVPPPAPPTSTAYSAPVTVAGAPEAPWGGVEFQGKLFVTAQDANGSDRLYSFDGSAFALISDQIVDPYDLTVVGDKLYFSGTASNGNSVLYWFDGSEVDTTGVYSTSYGRTITAYGNHVMVANPDSGTIHLIDYNDGSINDIGTFESITSMVTYGNEFYFAGTPDGSYARMYVYDTVLLVDLHPGDYYAPLVWNDQLYLAFAAQNYGLYTLLPPPDWSLNPATFPLVEYVSELTDAGDRMYFRASNAVDSVLYSFDGTTATELAGSPLYPQNLTMYNGSLIFTGDATVLSVCSVSETSCGLPGGTFAFDGTRFTTISGVPDSAGAFVTFQGRLYFTDGSEWKYIEPASLADTGIDAASAVTLGSMGALAIALGLVVTAFLRARRKIPSL